MAGVPRSAHRGRYRPRPPIVSSTGPTPMRSPRLQCVSEGIDRAPTCLHGEGCNSHGTTAELISCNTPLCDPFTLVEQMHILSLQAKIAISDTFQISTSIVLFPRCPENGKKAFRDLRGTLSSLTGINKRTLLSAHVVLG